MAGLVTFAVDGKDDKSVTGMEKEELKEMRRGRMSKSERFRECSANVLKVILLFGVPVMLSLVMLIVLVAIYIIRPYALTRDFTRTSCEVTGYSILNHTSASCSAGTDPFQPCVKVRVSYHIGETHHTSVIMENEQALVNCNPCSYTFGRHGLIHHYQYACESWKENFNPELCVEDFIMKNAIVGYISTCYFNPHNVGQVVRDLVLDENMLIHSISWPILSCFIYFLGWGFICYDMKQRKLINKCIVAEIMYKKKRKQLERYHATEWKKQRLGQTLGVRSPIQSPNTFILRSMTDLKRISVSVQSLTDLNQTHSMVRQSYFTESTDDLDDAKNENFDLRHLDLAVSQQNLNDLTTTYPYVEEPPPLTYENVNAALGAGDRCHLGKFSRATLPVSPTLPFDTFQKNSKGKSTDALFRQSSSFSVFDRYKINRGPVFIGSASFTPLTNGSMFYQERQEKDLTDADAVSEDEIDMYYSVGKRFSENAAIDMKKSVFRRKDESRV